MRSVAMVGRPVARSFDDGVTLEVNRTATDGCANANSMLYGAAWRAAKALGYQRLITYTQAGESGTSLRAAGWTIVAELNQRKGWTTPSRPRDDRGVDRMPRTLWEAANDWPPATREADLRPWQEEMLKRVLEAFEARREDRGVDATAVWGSPCLSQHPNPRSGDQ